MSLAAALIVSAALAQAPDVTVLRAGATVERDLTAAERHEYDLPLEAGQQATLTLDQKAVDVMVRLLDASGNAVAMFDEEIRPQGREQVRIVADGSRNYRLVVSARYPKVARGAYAIWVDGITPAAQRDRDAFTARTLGTEGAALRAAGKFDAALDLLTKAVGLAESSLGPQDVYLASLLTNLAGVQRAKGLPREAEQTFTRAISILEATLGPDHPQTASVKEALGVMFNVMEDYGRAEPLLVGGTAVVERALGDHPRLAGCLMDLALFHTFRGDKARAMAELQRALQVSDKTMSPDEFTAIAIVNNLGDLYVSIKDYDRAQPLVERAVRDLERTLGPDSFRVATPLLNLSVIARERGDYPAALAHLQRAYALREKTYGKEHTESASLLISMGNIYHAQKDYPKALATYQEAEEVLERTAGPYHSLTLMAINNAARTLAGKGDVDAAIARRSIFEARLDRALAFNLAIGSERDKLAYLEQTFERMGRTISLHLKQAPANPDAAALAATAILRRKGRVLDALLDSRAILRKHAGAAQGAQLDELTRVTAELSTLSLAGPGRMPAGDYRAKLATLDARREALQSEISRLSAPFRAESQDVSIDAVRAALPQGSALIEFVAYRPFDPSAASDAAAHGEPRYAAYVILSGAPVRGMDLGTVQEVDGQVARWRAALRDPARADVVSLARTLDQAVLRPVRSVIGSATRLFVAPDGALNLVPFEALVDERGRFQVERYAISYLTGGRDLLRVHLPRAASGAPLVVADPDFGDPAPAAGGARTGSRSDEGRMFTPLTGTAREASAIKGILHDARILTGARATKEALATTASPRVLHIASHAYFDPAAGQDPLLRAGIALAGANRSSGGGIITGLEASLLDLWGTNLVTLSACDTGVGEIRSGEGVYGLRRAFSLAGAESLVMSLWPVSDYVTRTVMTEYYAGLARGLGREAALRRVQRSMLADPRRRHPFYWAAFIQAGDWRPLPGPR